MTGQRLKQFVKIHQEANTIAVHFFKCTGKKAEIQEKFDTKSSRRVLPFISVVD